MKKYLLLGVVVFISLLSIFQTASAQDYPKWIVASDGSYGNKVGISWVSDRSDPSWYSYYRSTANGTNVACNGTYYIGRSYEANALDGTFDDTTAVSGVRYRYAVIREADVNSCSADIPQFGGLDYGFRSPAPQPSISASAGTYTDKVLITISDTLKLGVTYDPGVSYLIQRNGSTIAQNLINTSYNDTGATPGVSYTYRVQTKAADGSYSNWSTERTGYRKMSMATGVTPSNNRSDGINVTWTAPASGGVAAYVVYRCVTQASCVGVSGLITATSFLDTGVAADQYYYYAVDTGGAGGTYWSGLAVSSAQGHRTAVAPPAAPVLQQPASATCSGTTVNPINLNWSGGTGPYSVGIIEGSRGTPPPNSTPFWHTATPLAGTSVSSNQLNRWTGTTDQGTMLALVANTTYSAWVWAGGSANFSNVVQFTTPTCAAANHTIYTSAGPGGYFSPTTASVADGANAPRFTAYANSGYRVSSFLVNGQNLNNTQADIDAHNYSWYYWDIGPTYQDVTLSATFQSMTPGSYTVTYVVSPPGAGTIVNPDNHSNPPVNPVPSGDVANFEVLPTAGYVFDHWTGATNNAINPSYTVVTSAKTVTAYLTSTTAACGTAQGVESATEPTTNLCSSGTVSNQRSNATNWLWDCTLAASTVGCWAPKPVAASTCNSTQSNGWSNPTGAAPGGNASTSLNIGPSLK
jgi:hypothetical protein